MTGPSPSSPPVPGIPDYWRHIQTKAPKTPVSEWKNEFKPDGTKKEAVVDQLKKAVDENREGHKVKKSQYYDHVNINVPAKKPKQKELIKKVKDERNQREKKKQQGQSRNHQQKQNEKQKPGIDLEI
ncbi:hypothetical protein HOC37_02215 [bacterium]|nr:hypothetical protein [bacterium]